MITATGWTFETLHESSACDVMELLKYWQEEPPAHVLLALRYLGERKPKRGPSEPDAMRKLGELQKMMGTTPRPMPPHLRDAMAWANEQNARMRGKKT